jgi:hypothetical protein
MQKFLCLDLICEKWACDNEKHKFKGWKLCVMILGAILCPFVILAFIPVKYFILKQTIAMKLAINK